MHAIYSLPKHRQYQLLCQKFHIFRCLENIHKNMSSVSLPFLLLHGENDSLCQAAGSHLLAKMAKSKDKKLKIYPGASHHLILEVFNIFWLLKKRRKQAGAGSLSWSWSLSLLAWWWLVGCGWVVWLKRN